MRLLCLTLLFPFILAAQAPRPGGLVPDRGWQELTISDGLSQGMVFDLKQDRKGFIWVATKDGLNRYDGHNFTVFTHDPYNPYSISENACSALLIDRHDRLWIGTLTNGLNLFDRRAQRFYHVSISDGATAEGGNYEIRSMSEDPDGNIWLSTDKNQLFKLTVPDNGITDQLGSPDLTSRLRSRQISIPGHEIGIHHIQFNPNGEAILGTTDGMSTINWRHPGKITPINRIKYQGTDINYRGTDIGSMSDDALPNYWFSATWEGVFGWKNGVVKTRWFTSKNTNNVKLKCLDAHTIAIATVDHLWVMSPEAFFRGDSLTAANAYTTMPPDLFGIKSLLKDQMGTIWVGTAGYGLRLFNTNVKLFQTYLPTHSLSYLYQDRQGRTYVRQAYAYDRIDRATNRLTPLDRAIATNGALQRFMMQDHRNQFWVTYTIKDRYLLKKYAPDWKPLKDYAIPAGVIFGDYGNQTIEDKTGALWLGAGNGKLVRFDPVTESFQVFSYAHLLPQKGATVETYALYVDRAQTLWIGTQKGLIRATNLTTRPVFTLFKNSTTDRASLSNDFVSCVVDDPYQPARYLWVSTKGGGLERFDKQTNTFNHFTEAQGLPNKVVYGILTDSFNNLWVSTNRGLGQFDPKTFRFRNYTKVDGLQDDEFNTGSFFKTASGELLFGGINGLTAFRPAEFIKANALVPQAHIIGLKVNNKPVAVGGNDKLLTTTIEDTPEIDLDYTQNLLSFEFGVTNYTNTANNRYRYKLNGIDDDWIEAGGTHVANYAQLPIGDYKLDMMGSANGNVWSRPVTLLVRIHPPFYRTWWAYLLYAIILAVAGWQLYLFQRQRLLLRQQLVFEQKEASRLTELDALKTRFFANISHEFRTPLTLISGPVEQMAREYADDWRFPILQQNAQRLLGLINQLLDLTKLEAGQLKPEPESGDLAGFIRLLASSFTSLADSQQINFTFAQPEAAYPALFDRDKVEKIVTNLLSNAFKFTPAGKAVVMEVAYREGMAFLTIQDTGIGIAADKLPRIFDRFYQVDGKMNRSYEGTGIGLALVKELVQVLGGTVSVDSTEGAGTTFRVMLPVTQINQPVGELTEVTTRRPNQVVDQPTSQHRRAGSAPMMPAVEKTDNLLLIIDDNADIRAFVRSIFEADYQILEAVDGQEGLEKATEQLPNMVICDLMMPRLDGFGFCRALKTQTATSHIPVVMLTAKATTEDRIEGFDLGADDYLTKPFNQTEIQVRVRNLIRQRERLGQYFRAQLGLVAAPVAEQLIAKENDFLQKVQAIVDAHLAENGFDVETLSERLNLSQRQLVRKLKALTGQTAVEFIRNRRLEQGAILIQQGDLMVSEVAYQVGFESLSYFTRSFEEKFGVLPSAYRAGQEKAE